MPQPSDYLIYGSILIAIALGFIVAALVILYVKLLREHERLRQEKARMAEVAEREAEEVLAKAQRSAEALINDAHLRAGEIIKKTEVLSADSKNKMLAELEEV